jgi:hypothetical protein
MGRRSVGIAAALLSAGCAVVYLMIGLEVVHAVAAPAATAPSMLAFGVLAALAFALGAVLLLAVDRRSLWVLGAVLQVIVLVMYLAVSSTRTAPFEMWGILLKIAQFGILVALVDLAVRPVANTISLDRNRSRSAIVGDPPAALGRRLAPR